MSFTLAAAAEAAKEDGDDDDAPQHGHGDDQNLEVDWKSKGRHTEKKKTLEISQ